MVNIDLLTIGNEFKDVDGNIYKVVSNFSQDKKIFVELNKLVDEEQIGEIIP